MEPLLIGIIMLMIGLHLRTENRLTRIESILKMNGNNNQHG